MNTCSKKQPAGYPAFPKFPLRFTLPSFAEKANRVRKHKQQIEDAFANEVRIGRELFMHKIRYRLQNAEVGDLVRGTKGILEERWTLVWADQDKERVFPYKLEHGLCRSEGTPPPQTVEYICALPVSDEQVATVGSIWLIEKFNCAYNCSNDENFSGSMHVMFPAPISERDYEYLAEHKQNLLANNVP